MNVVFIIRCRKMDNEKQKQASLFRRFPHAKGLADFSLNALKTLIPNIHDCVSAGRIEFYTSYFIYFYFWSINLFSFPTSAKIQILTKHYRVHYTLEPPIIS